MTVKKAIEIIDWILAQKTQIKNDFLDPKQSWNQGPEKVTQFTMQLVTIVQTDINILKIIREQLVPDCKHPKKDRDLDPSTKKPYCMACNWDL